VDKGKPHTDGVGPESGREVLTYSPPKVLPFLLLHIKYAALEAFPVHYNLGREKRALE